MAPGHSGGGFLLEDGPVEHIVVLVVEGAEEDAEQLPQVHVVGRLLEPQPAAVVQVHCKLGWIALGIREVGINFINQINMSK